MPLDGYTVTITPMKLRTVKPRLNGKSGGAAAAAEDSIDIRCLATLKVWYLKDDLSSKQHADDSQVLFRQMRRCCILSCGTGKYAAINMVHGGFEIDSTDFIVATRLSFAQTYRYELSLMQVDQTAPWPPMILEGSAKQRLGSIPLVARWNRNWNDSSSCIASVYFDLPEGSQKNARLILKIQNNGSFPNSTSRPDKIYPSITKAQRSTSISDLRVALEYTLFAPVERFGKANMKGQASYVVNGYACFLCDGYRFKALDYLKFHFRDIHPRLSFKVCPGRKFKPLPSVESKDNGLSADIVIDVFVDLADEDEEDLLQKVFTMIKPLDHKTVVRGAGAARIRTQSKVDWENLPMLPERPRQRHKVPKPLHTTKTSKVYVSTRSRRYIQPGEVLSDSDADDNDFWIQREHEAALDDFGDVSPLEKAFMKLWDAHFMKEQLPGNVFLASAIYRFTKLNKERLGSDLFVEFTKKLVDLIRSRAIDTTVYWEAISYVKGSPENWSSHGKVPYKIGLAPGYEPRPAVKAEPVGSFDRIRIDDDIQMMVRKEVNQGNQAKKDKEAEPVKQSHQMHCLWDCKKMFNLRQMVRCKDRRREKRKVLKLSL
ncbi:Similar to Polycomb protein Su(z)12; acc. no. Q9NJG9 [Pyronema omphalodes CBS 100304]|uniref:Similar to Polycomb protein Su(Z)12 acc. no. Q9NJG9 n=1 Tax=Pyronema omphalodes (strain CBS 100304) TaxID=1076935 RepID=U4LL06_PYROM|nr:Similar to Polycomb protein Su(z)12; acc. no. Q9NJG9 [Pyronema omphalodes CBS 100304]